MDSAICLEKPASSSDAGTVLILSLIAACQTRPICQCICLLLEWKWPICLGKSDHLMGIVRTLFAPEGHALTMQNLEP